MQKLMRWLIPLSAVVALGCENGDATSGTQVGAGSPAGKSTGIHVGASGSAGKSTGIRVGAGGDQIGTGGAVVNSTSAGSSGAGAVGSAGASAFGKAGSGGSTASSSGPGYWVAGDYPPGITEQTFLEIAGVPGQGNNVRQYKVHIPPSYDPKIPAPLVFCIHGLNQDAVMFCVTGAGMDTLSDKAGFVLVMPNGYQNSWNAGTCCGAASAERLDDVALFRAIFKEVQKHVNVDLTRVYVTGLSNGGFMSYRLACEATDILAAVAPGAGAVGTNDIGAGPNKPSDDVASFIQYNTDSNFIRCEPSRPIPVLAIHGTEDPLVPYGLYAPSLEHMALKNGCSTTTQPALQPRSGGDTTCVTYQGCPPGIELTGCSVDQGGHCWFGSEDCGTGAGFIGSLFVGANSDTLQNSQAVWEFLKRFSR